MSLKRERDIIRRALRRDQHSVWSPEQGQWLLGPHTCGPERIRHAELSLPLTDPDGSILPLGRAWLQLNPGVSLDHDAARRCYESAWYDELNSPRRLASGEQGPPQVVIMTVLARQG
jgi:hypothetical protein